VFSGDLVRRDAEGLLYYVGRRDRMIKTLGYRVSPDEIADVMYQSGEIEEGVIVAEPCEQRGERIVAHVVLRGEGSVQRLKVHCGAELPRYMQPVRFELHDALPRNGNGKHDILALVNGTTTAAALTS
jgi:acyl-CoA synthetase (AMP-forming)/AMP-acid ligase II